MKRLAHRFRSSKGQQPLEFRYAGAFGDLPDAFPTLIPNIAGEDQTHFVGADEVEAARQLYAPASPVRLFPHPLTNLCPQRKIGAERQVYEAEACGYPERRYPRL